MKLGLHSLLARILWWHGIAVLVTAVAVSAGVYLFLDSTADRFQRGALRVQAERAQDMLRIGTDGRTRFAAGGRATEPPPTFSITVLDVSGRAVANAGSAVALSSSRIPRHAEPAYFTRRSGTAVFSGYSLPVISDGTRVWVVSVQNLEHPDYIVDDIVRQFLAYGLIIVSPLLLLLLAVDAWIIRRALRPVNNAPALVHTLNPQSLDVRVPEAELPSEVRPLASAVNAALDQVVDSYRSQRDFTADAAHELRTPVTVARMRIEAVEDPVLRSELKRDLDQMGRLVQQLLEIAELDGAPPALHDKVDLHSLAAEAVSGIAPLVFRRGQTIGLTGDDGPIRVRGNAEMIARALNGLMENAVAHTPAGTAITVDVRSDGTISVRDDGPGIMESDQELVFQRFWRGNRSGTSGSGLGLAIASRIAEAHDAEVSLRTRAGETVFSLKFEI